MSTAWKGPVVLLREPPEALAMRLGRRLLLASLLVVAAVLAPWAWLAVIAWVFAVLMFLTAALAVANVAVNKRQLLVYTGAGSIEWPRSLQERWLRRPQSWVAGKTVTVTYPLMAVVPGRADPRITLSDGERLVERVPLYGVTPEAFVESANELLVGRGTTLVYEPAS